MNAAAIRAERAIADWFGTIDWSSSLLGTPSFLTSYGKGAFNDPDLEDQMPDFPRVVISVTQSNPVMPKDTTCEMSVRIDLQVSADDSTETQILSVVRVLENALQDLFIEGGASVLNASISNDNGPFTAQFATPTDFGSTNVSDRSRVFSRTLTLFASATT